MKSSERFIAVFAILFADKVTDCSNKEQLCIVIRYVEPDTATIREDLDTFLECYSRIIGKALANKILGFVRNHLDPSKIHGQAYGGASNMSGKTIRAAVRISSQYPSPFIPIALLTV